jgi:hypothetical protein
MSTRKWHKDGIFGMSFRPPTRCNPEILIDLGMYDLLLIEKMLRIVRRSVEKKDKNQASLLKELGYAGKYEQLINRMNAIALTLDESIQDSIMFTHSFYDDEVMSPPKRQKALGGLPDHLRKEVIENKEDWIL